MKGFVMASTSRRTRESRARWTLLAGNVVALAVSIAGLACYAHEPLAQGVVFVSSIAGAMLMGRLDLERVEHRKYASLRLQRECAAKPASLRGGRIGEE
jgi:hypothetical protein